MNIISIDSSGSSLSIALQKSDDTIVHSDTKATRASQIILSNINQIMSDNSMKVSDLNAFIFNKGPASFTGTRISASVGQAIGYSQNIPVVGISSLSIMAYAYFKQSNFSKIVCIKKAYGEKFYVASYDIKKKKYMALDNITLCAAEDLFIDDAAHYLCDCWADIKKKLDNNKWSKVTKHDYGYDSNAVLLLEYAKHNITFESIFNLKKTFPDYANHTIET